MKILLTGGGTGGHFYPLIAIAEELNLIAKENKLLPPELFYMSTEPYNQGMLFDNNINFVSISSGKIRKKFGLVNSVLNFFDIWKICWGSFVAIWKVFSIYPDVVFGKGGYASFPALFAARILRIPVVIHESDSRPGKVNMWAGKFARRIALSYPDAAQFFPIEKTAYTGNPIRKQIEDVMPRLSANEFYNLNPDIKTILILGGSQGAKFINEIIMNALPELVKKYQIIHQTGRNNINVIKETSSVVLENNPNKNRYMISDYLDVVHMRAAAGASSVVISRAGSTIFEIASWGKPSIIIPIPEPTSHDQRSNAFAFARSGASVVIEEKNLASGLLISEIDRILDNESIIRDMSKAATEFARRDSAKLIAMEITDIGLEHEK